MVLLAAMRLSVPLYAQEKPQPITDEEFHLAIDPQIEAEVDRLIERLGSPVFAERERASRRLLDIGAQAFSPLRAAYNDSDDLEVRLRIETIVYEAFLDHHVFRRMGYLGISRGRRQVTHGDDGRVPQGRVGITLQQVNADTAAERAGLLANDVLMALDGEFFEGDFAESFKKFAAKIQAKGPGSRVTLTILRGHQKLDVPVILGKPPRQSKLPIQNLSGKLALAKRRFALWWNRYFRRPTEQAGQDSTSATAGKE